MRDRETSRKEETARDLHVFVGAGGFEPPTSAL
jgi:hypothetical protein